LSPCWASGESTIAFGAWVPVARLEATCHGTERHGVGDGTAVAALGGSSDTGEVLFRYLVDSTRRATSHDARAPGLSCSVLTTSASKRCNCTWASSMVLSNSRMALERIARP